MDAPARANSHPDKLYFLPFKSPAIFHFRSKVISFSFPTHCKDCKTKPGQALIFVNIRNPSWEQKNFPQFSTVTFSSFYNEFNLILYSQLPFVRKKVIIFPFSFHFPFTARVKDNISYVMRLIEYPPKSLRYWNQK